jgi:hypothetical protein
MIDYTTISEVLNSRVYESKGAASVLGAREELQYRVHLNKLRFCLNKKEIIRKREE